MDISVLPSLYDMLYIADLIYFDEFGATVTLFRDNDTDKQYLYIWCDNTDTCNRWIVINIDDDTLNKFLNKHISLKNLILNCGNKSLYLVDVNDGLEYETIVAKNVYQLPKSYLPNGNIYYNSDYSLWQY